MEYNYWRFSIQYFGIALVILTSVAGGLAKELRKKAFENFSEFYIFDISSIF
jgi:hypothetical protein